MKISRIAFASVLALMGCPAGTTTTETPPPAEVTSFTVSPAQVAKPGDMVTLTWATKDAKSITLEQVGKGPLSVSATDASGSTSVAINADTTFVLTARGEGGTDSSVQTATVMGMTGGFVFDASPKTLQAGESTTLVWNVPGASSVTIKPAGGAALDLKGQTSTGSVLVTPATDTKYEISTDSTLGSVDVVVVPQIVSFTTTPSSPGSSAINLSWEVVGGASKLTLERDGAAMPLLTETAPGNIARGQFTETPPTVPAGGIYTYHLKIEHGGVTQTADLTVRAGGAMRIEQFVVPTYVRAGVPAAVSWRTSGGAYLEIQVDDVPVYVASSKGAVDAAAATLPAITAASARVKLFLRDSLGGVLTLEKTVSTVSTPVFVSFTADRNTVGAGGEPVVLSWEVTNARNVRIVQEGVGLVHAIDGNVDTGSVTVYPNQPTVTYTLQASNGANQSVPPNQVTVTVTTLARLTFQGPAPVGTNGTVTGHTVVGGAEVFGLPVVEKNAAGDAFVDITNSTELFPFDADVEADSNEIGEMFTGIVFGRRIKNDSISFSPNGWFAFVDGFVNGPNTNGPIGTAHYPLAIVPYFRDLRFVSGVSHGWGRVDTANGERRYIVQWSDVEDKAVVGSRLTFQAQVYSGGRVIFAYQKLQGITTVNGAIGIVNGSNNRVLAPPAAPVAGDTFRFFGAATLPLTMPTENAVYVARVATGAGFVQVEGDERYWLQITEANPRPAASVTNGEWFEVLNTTPVALDLNGYTLNFGGTNTHVISQSVIVPANSRVVLAQALDLGDPGAGVTAAYVYPSTLTMPDTSGAVSLVVGGSNYSTLTWSSTSATAVGVSVKADTQIAKGVYTTAGGIVCPGTGTYGAQTGTPGAAHSSCFPYVMSLVTGNFEPIAMTGTQIAASADDTTYTVATPIRYLGATVPTIYVCSNGWITTTSTTSTNSTPRTTPGTSAPVGSIAPFWADLDSETGMGVGIYRTTRDPDGMAASGDEYTIISWENFHFYDADNLLDSQRLNFQVKFFANGNIEYHYGAGSSPFLLLSHLGTRSTSWLEDPTGRGALVANMFSTLPGTTPQTAFRFAYTP